MTVVTTLPCTSPAKAPQKKPGIRVALAGHPPHTQLMSLYKELAYDRVVSRVKGVQFGILSPDEIRRRSVCEVTEPRTFEGSDPVPNGLFDLRMGTIDNARTCATCMQRVAFCPGHHGHVTLARACFYIQFFDIVRKLLGCVCFRCGKCLLNMDAPDVKALLSRKGLSNQKRWEAMSKLCARVRRCGQDTLDGCGAKKPDKISKTDKTDELKIKMTWKDVDAPSTVREQVFSADDVMRILRRVSDADAEALGFNPKYNRPEWMVCSVLLVPPPSVRPSVRHETGQRQEDHLTHKLHEIIKHNSKLRDVIAKGASHDTVDNWINLLQYHVVTLIDNSLPSMYPSKDRAGQTFRSLTERLKHKEGRIRGNLMGKRVDFSARTVITPDPNLSIDELGVPLKIAMNLTFPEVVNEHNIDEMRALVVTGPEGYPGAKHVRKTAEGNRTVRLKGHPDPSSIVLEPGDVVERHLRNGDYVLFNRQPSLHKMSMMAHRVRVMDYMTFRLNVCVCACYNADFDGDEMNMHVPQSLQTHHELRELAAVPLHVVSPRYSKPIITIVQDVALGVFRITQGDVRVSQRQLFNLVASNPLLDPATLPLPVEPGRWSGRQALSTVLPPSVSVRMANGNKDRDDPTYNPDDDEVVIQNGVIRQGVLNTKVYDKESTGLVHAAYNALGPPAVVALLNGTQKIICDWLVLSGFSVGVSDLVVTPDTVASMRTTLDAAKAEVYKLLHKVHEGTFENVSTKSVEDFLEDQISAVLSRGSDAAGKRGRGGFDASNNRMLNMIQSGSKGKPLNFQQMVACLGPQSIENKRVPDGFDQRTLPHYCKYDDGPEARGFVEHSFIDGLEPHEFFFHSMAGRIGLIDTAVRSVTWETPVVITEDGKAKYVRIGEWIDAHLEANKDKEGAIKVFPEDRNLELLDLDTEVHIPTVDGDGNVTWGRMTAVTRHDPGDRLYKVVTEGGREVTVAESKSLLVWDVETSKFVEKDSREVKVGDFVPVTSRLPDAPSVPTHVEVSDFLSKTDHIYGTDFNLATRSVKAANIGAVLWEDDDVEWVDATSDQPLSPSDCRRLTEEAQAGKYFIPRGWWAENNGKAFTLPYSKKALLTRANSGRSNVDNIKDGCVYPYHATRCHGDMPDRCGDIEDCDFECDGVCAADPDGGADAIPDRFELNFEFGTFIGLYLADGHTCEKSGVVGITKNEPSVREFAKAWFEKYGFTTRLQANTNELGTSYTMVCNSTLLARFLDRFVGHGARNKHVPDVAFAAPMDFVRGLLSGYLSGDSEIKRGAICWSSVSKRLLEGISFACARIGVFAKMTSSQQPYNNIGTVDIARMYRLTVRAQWARLLCEQTDIVHTTKKEACAGNVFSDKHVKFKEHSDVVLDPIKSIEVLGVEAHPKLYDVTVPSTLNFVLANGMGTVDTSETGYLQRKLVKAMEDCKIQHDLTVRNASGHIVQFLYGEDGMDAVKLEFQKLPYLTSDPADMRAPYLLSSAEELRGFSRDEVVDSLSKDEGKWRPRLEAHYRQLLDDRRDVIMGLCNGLADDQPVVYPVNIGRIVMSTADLYAAVGCAALSDLDPVWVLDQVDALALELRVGMEARNAGAVHWMPLLLRCFLSPKVLIRKHRLNKLAFDRVIAQVRAAFYDAIAAPSEMVGIVAAQSVGEPTTQLSTISTCRVLVSSESEPFYNGTIGTFIDRLLDKHADRVVDLGGDSVVLDIPEGEQLRIVGVSDEEKTSWRRISQVSRHPANGGMVRIHTQSGKTTCATLSHSFLKRTESGIAPVLGSDLKVGDRVPVARVIPAVADPLQTIRIGDKDYELTRDLGWFFGAFLADGSVNGSNVTITKIIPEFIDKMSALVAGVFGREITTRRLQGTGTLQGWDMSKYQKVDSTFSHANLASFLATNGMVGSHIKRVPAWVYASNLDFIRGIIGGYFDGDGNVNAIYGKGAIRSASVSEGLTEDFVLLLAYVGIFASKCKETHHKEVGRNDLHTIQISRKLARKFKEEVGLVVASKAEALDLLIAYADRENAKEDSEGDGAKVVAAEKEAKEGGQPKKGDTSLREEIDMIPEICPVIAYVGTALNGRSNLYHKYLKKTVVGRRTLCKYISRFEAMIRDGGAIQEHVKALEALLEADADKKGRIPLPDGAGARIAFCNTILRACGNNVAAYATKTSIDKDTLRKHVDNIFKADMDRRTKLPEIEAKMALLRQAADADVVWDRIVKLEILPDPQEYVYDFTVPGNDSFMVDCGVLVHNTLNSVTHDTELLLRVDGKLKRADIGDFVEQRIALEEELDPIDPEEIERNLDAIKPLVYGDDLYSGILKRAREWADDVLCEEKDDGSKDTTWTRVSGSTERLRHCFSSCNKSHTYCRKLQDGASRLERHPHDTTLAWLKDGGDEGVVPSGVEVLSCDQAGNVSWKEVTAVTRHPVVNKDGSNTMLRVTTRGGREVTATKAKSFLMRRDNKIREVHGDELKVGDRIPVSKILPVGEEVREIQIADVDVVHDKHNAEDLVRKYELDSDFGFIVGAYMAVGYLPLHTTSSARFSTDFELYKGRIKDICKARQLSTSEWSIEDETERDDCVLDYPKQDDQYGGGLFSSVYIREESYAALLWSMGNPDDSGKRLPGIMLGAPKEFVEGFVDAFFSGTGAIVEQPDGSLGIAAISVSRGLLQDVRQVLLRFGIASAISLGRPADHEIPVSVLHIVGDDAVRFAETFNLVVEEKQACLDVLSGKSIGDVFVSPLSGILGTPFGYRPDGDIEFHHANKWVKVSELPEMLKNATDPNDVSNLAYLVRKVYPPLSDPVDLTYPEGALSDVVPDVVLKSGTINISRRQIPRLLERTADPDDRAVLEAVLQEDVMYDEIVSIEEVPNPTPYVYDLTVRDTRNFNLLTGLAMVDTFHLAGAATASTVTSGVPRMKELMSMSKNIKTPAMTIYLKREWATSMERAADVMANVQTTRFRDLVKSSAVYFDPSDAETTIPDDAGLMRFYKEFGAIDRLGCAASASPWLLRFEFDRAKMLDLKVTMSDIEHVLTKFYADAVTCVFSDDNAEQLVCRLRIVVHADTAAGKEDTESKHDLLTEIKALEQSIIETGVVKGVKGVKKAVLARPNTGLKKYDAVLDVFVDNDEWTIATAGSNLMEVMRNDFVDYARTTTNDVFEVYNVLGIEAARQVLIAELRNVLGDLKLDHRHLSLLADTMSNRGFFMSVDRHGINHRGELGPFAKASFECSTDMLVKSSVFAERDRMNGVSACIILGQAAAIGTGDTEVLIDGERLAKLAKPVPLPVEVAGAPGANRGRQALKHNNDNNNRRKGDNRDGDNENGGPALPPLMPVMPIMPALGAPGGDDEEGHEVVAKDADELVIV